MTLVEFLLARIAEDEAIARDVAAERVRVGEAIDYPAEGEDRSFWADYDGAGPSVSVGADRVLAECEAKRRIVERYEQAVRLVDANSGEFSKAMCSSARDQQVITALKTHGWELAGRRDGLEYALVAIALPYADHPDCDEEWRP